MSMKRFCLLAALVVGFGLLGGAKPAVALVQIDLTKGNVQPLPIAITDFSGEQGVAIAGVITNNLRRSGLFSPIDKDAFIEKNLSLDSTPQFASWKVINAQALVTGRVTPQPDGRLKAEFRLWDVLEGKQVTGSQYFTKPDNWRRVAHIISDAIYERLTGEKGYFDTRVVFVSETGPKARRVKRLAIMDQDGANVRNITDGGELVLTPRFSPSSQDITYMGYAGEEPRVYLMDLNSGRREVVGNFPGMTFAPRFSPDGQKVVMSLQQGGSSNIFSMDLRSRTTTRLTTGSALDTAPSYSPDGRQIVFESDRGGNTQLYVMGSDGSSPKRISFGEGAYSQPVWSPRGDLIAFTKRAGGQFGIGVMRPDGTGERMLVSGYHNEGPTFAPNGRVIMFFRDPGGEAGPSLYSVDISGRNEQRIPVQGYASDPAWSPLLH